MDALVDTEVAISGTLPRSGNLEPGLGRGGDPLAGEDFARPRRDLSAQMLGGRRENWEEASSPVQQKQRDSAEAGEGRAGAGELSGLGARSFGV